MKIADSWHACVQCNHVPWQVPNLLYRRTPSTTWEALGVIVLSLGEQRAVSFVRLEAYLSDSSAFQTAKLDSTHKIE
eukprot:scaffold3226_cov160-Amphora_coffeaeformis.AAC.17